MFNCLKDKRENNVVNVVKDMDILVERIRFSDNDEGYRKKNIMLLPAKIISIQYKNFYLIEIQSNYDLQPYRLAIFKSDFHQKFSNNILKL